MLEFRNVKVYDLPESLVSSGYAMSLSWDEYGQHIEDMGLIYDSGLSDNLFRFALSNAFEEKTWNKSLSEVEVTHYKDGPYKIILGDDESDKLTYIFDGVPYETDIKMALAHEYSCASDFTVRKPCVYTWEITCGRFKKLIADAIRVSRLKKASDSTDVHCHDNWMKGVRVSFDMKYTQYITKQFQRYNWFDYVSSSSLMHRITKMDFSKCCNKYVTNESIEQMKSLIVQYNEYVENRTEYETFVLSNGTVIEARSYTEVLYHQMMRIISNCPMGTELFVHVSTNYKQLQTIYRQRRHHKLKEDWSALTKMVEDLPLSPFLIV